MRNDFGGVADIYSIGAEAARGVPRLFCRRYRMTVANSWAVPKHTDEVASAFANAWRRRHQHFFDTWSVHGSMDYKFTAVELDSYRPPDDWIRIRNSFPSHSEERARADMLDAEVPINP